MFEILNFAPDMPGVFTDHTSRPSCPLVRGCGGCASDGGGPIALSLIEDRRSVVGRRSALRRRTRLADNIVVGCLHLEAYQKSAGHSLCVL